ncbi:hypothetical protein BDY19DRAFT_997771 [Irpex rosettiformis]|uniref:Uncharacterized protein n=1 Tax=Irpex rosettiformis TaxID=378272 RepID=A0ACB8TQW5_9APHY|nr:hypothetical protein BDY19DRAFT_997771 [Irpex rosettiformis]
MSGPSDPEIQQIFLEQTSTYIYYSANVLYLFESCITLSQEVRVIWKRKWTFMTWLYAFTRYSAVLLSIMTFIPVWSQTQLTFCRCEIGQYASDALDSIQFMCLALFSALRVYALLDGQIFVAGIALFLILAPFATNMYNDVVSMVVMDDEICTTVALNVSEGLALGRKFSLGTRISVIIGDVLVLLVTWSKTAKSYNEARKQKIESPLAMMLFRDGTLYFGVLLIINVLEVIQRNIPSLFTVQLSGPFLQIIPPIIVCRFILNLRQVKPAGISCISSNQSASVGIRFAGNAGESLKFGEDDELEDDFVERSAHAEERDVLAVATHGNHEDLANPQSTEYQC